MPWWADEGGGGAVEMRTKRPAAHTRWAAGTLLLLLGATAVLSMATWTMQTGAHAAELTGGTTTLGDESWQNLQISAGTSLAATQPQVSPQQQLAQYLQQSGVAPYQSQQPPIAPYQTQQLPALQTTVSKSTPCGTTTTTYMQPLCETPPCGSPCGATASAPATNAAPWYYPVRSSANVGLMPGAEQVLSCFWCKLCTRRYFSPNLMLYISLDHSVLFKVVADE